MKNYFYNFFVSLSAGLFIYFLFTVKLTAQPKINSSENAEGAIQLQNESTLKEAFKNHFIVGAALNLYHVTQPNEIDASILKKHFNSITPENDFKWEKIHPQQDKYFFEATDKFVEYAEANNLALIGHTLIWHNQTPAWVFEDEEGKPVDKTTLLNRMRDHIQTVVGKYKGRIKGWDVVNEALEENGTLRQSQWLKIIGEEYIEKAFEFAHEADPGTELYYNDFSLENKPKRDGAVELVKKLKAKGVNISAVGLQGHYKMDWPSASQLDSTVKAFAGLGVPVMITELDVDVLPYKNMDVGAEITLNYELEEKMNPYKNGLPDSVQNAFTERYKDLFNVFINNSEAVERVTFWGITDKDSWLNYWPIKGRSNYPLLFDRNGQPKPAYDVLIKLIVK